MIEKKKVVGVSENAVLVGLIQKDQTEQQVNEYLDELAFLAETAGAVTVKRFTQKMSHPDSKTFLGKGKLEEISNYISFKGNIDLVIFDDELTGAQIINIEKVIGKKPCAKCDEDVHEATWDPISLVMSWTCSKGHQNSFKVN